VSNIYVLAPETDVRKQTLSNIYALAPQPDVRKQTVSNIYAVAPALGTLKHAYKGTIRVVRGQPLSIVVKSGNDYYKVSFHKRSV
jgi:hypothetical protein